MSVNAPALDQARSTIRAAWVSALGAVLAAVIAAVVPLIDGGETVSGAGPAASTPTPNSTPRGCGEMVAEVLALARSYPKVAAAYGAPGTARLPALAEEHEVRRCGGASPERLLESYYARAPRDGG
jgi:hypothetical protein